jgi:hypothetical protein
MARRKGGKASGAFGAQGQSGGEAISARLDQLATEAGVKGFRARVEYLTKSAAGQDAMIAAGIDLNNRSTRRTVLGWLSDPDATTSAKYRQAVDRAYSDRRRETMKAKLKDRLSNGGRGTRVEVHPVNQSAVPVQHQRDLNMRRVNVRPSQWDQLVDAWATGNTAGMDAIWEGIAADTIGSEWGAYVMVSSVGFGA